MTTESIQIRAARADELPVIHELLTAAFGPGEAPRIIRMVDEALDDRDAERVLSIVAVRAERIVGYVLFTPATVEGGGKPIQASILAPLAVHPDVQRRGIGRRLIESGFEALRRSDVERVFVLGDPAYYSRSGFEPVGHRGPTAPYTLPSAYADAWMQIALHPGGLGGIEGRVRCVPALDHEELWVE
jgi:predicted N-acetyltransferase YhbS